jgi:hypothetical protein
LIKRGDFSATLKIAIPIYRPLELIVLNIIENDNNIFLWLQISQDTATAYAIGHLLSTGQSELTTYLSAYKNTILRP